jgi:insulysin
MVEHLVPVRAPHAGSGSGSTRISPAVPVLLVLAAVALAAALAAPAAPARAGTSVTNLVVDLDARRPGDESQLRALTLDNQLTVLLVSDPKMQKSAAALDVAVGSMEDPENALGTAHFLEHLLFLGTAKYADVDEYSKYLAANGGSSNAYTADDRTNYQLEVNHDAFAGALDRFAQFFIAPAFNPEFVDRERNAVNSEHQKNVQNDNWRTNQVFTDMARQGHPFGKFSTGTLETLAGASREEIMAFYEKYYSANVMKLCILSNQPLDTLEVWARDRFSAVPNRNRQKLVYPTDVWDAKALPRQVEVKPVTERRSLDIQFALPSTEPHWREKPLRLLGALIGHEGKGSLLSALKRENLATSLSAGENTYGFTSFFEASVTLTENGRANVDRVVELFFAYIDLLRREGVPSYFFDEMKTMADVGYLYRDHEEGLWIASSYAAAMQLYPPLDILKNQRLFFQYDPQLFQKYLDGVRPERMQLLLVAPDVTTDTADPFYGAEYQVTPIAKERLTRFTAAKAGTVQAAAPLSMPEKNQFLPDDLSLLANDLRTEPYKLIADERGTFWFQQDRVFKLPKAEVDLLFLSDVPRSGPRERLLTLLYARAVKEGLNEWLYPAVLAGLGAGVSGENRGIRVTVGGYAERVPDLLADLCARLDELTIDERTFAALKDDARREIANALYSQPFQQTFYEYQILTNPDAIHRQEYADLIDSVTLDEVKAFAKQILEESAIEGVAYGNLDPAALRQGIDSAFQAAAGSVLPPARRPGVPFVKIEPGSAEAWVFSTKSDNNCWFTVLQFGPRDYRREAILRVGAAYLESGFYNEMRTRQQLGYTVFSFPELQNPIQGMGFLIQSGDYAAGELRMRAMTWLAEAVPAIKTMPPAEFEGLKKAIAADLLEVDTDISERMGTLAYEAVRLDGDLDRDQKVAAAVATLTVDEVATAFAAALARDTAASLSIYYDAAGKAKTVPPETKISDLATFRAKHTAVF